MTIKNQKGAAIVEFAIVLPLLIIMFIGICEFGLLWYNKQVVINASRESARAGIAREYNSSTNTANGDSDPIVNAYCANRLITFAPPVDPVTIYFPPNNSLLNFGDDFLVLVTYQYNFLVAGLFHLNLPTTFFGRTMMKMEHKITPSP